MWKTKVVLHFSSTLADSTMEQKSAFLRLWMGDEGLPLIMKWTDTGRLDFSKPTDPPSSGYILQTYWDLLEEELKPMCNRLISIQELFSERSRQSNRTLLILKIELLGIFCSLAVILKGPRILSFEKVKMSHYSKS